MDSLGNPSIQPTFGRIFLKNRSIIWHIAAIVGGTLFLTLSSYIVVPMYPVPITMQTFAVTFLGAVYGWRLGTVTVVAWLIEAAAGLPVLAGGASGLSPFVGLTGGYMLSFPVIAAVTGWLAERGWTGHRIVLSFLALLMGNVLCLVFGAAWLARSLGPEMAILFGIAPFLIGAALKSALGAAILKVLAQLLPRVQP